MRVFPLAGAVASILLANFPVVYAWGAAGHEIIATIAQIHLHPSVLPVLCDILNSSEPASPSSSTPCHLAPVAAWADRVRRQPEYRYTAQLHYVGALDDSPGASCAFPGPRGWAGGRDHNVLAAVGNTTRVLQSFLQGARAGTDGGAEALMFLIHFVGDMHMPLHLTGRERGGNGARVLFDRRITNLHTVWDNLLIAQGLRTVPQNYTRALPEAPQVEAHLRGAIYDLYVRRIMHEGFAEGRFGAYHDWLACSAPDARASPSLLESVQAFVGLGVPAGEERRWDDGVLCPYAWAGAIHTLNCELPVWPHELDAPAAAAADSAHSELRALDEVVVDGGPRPHPGVLELDTPEYAGRIRAEWVVERLLAMAGIRLAGILNGLVLGAEGAVLPVIVA